MTTTLVNNHFSFKILTLSHEGRGVAIFHSDAPALAEKNGKKVFIENALPHETVHACITHEKKHYAEAICTAIIDNKNTDRAQPVCQHYEDCGGCQLQHMPVANQRQLKTTALEQQLTSAFGYENIDLKPTWLPLLTTNPQHYRRKVRLGVRMVKGKLILGFREKQSNRLTAIHHCSVLHPAINNELPSLKKTLAKLSNAKSLTHIEIIVGDAQTDTEEPAAQDKAPVTALIRHERKFSQADLHNLLTTLPSNWQLLSQTKKGAKPTQLAYLHDQKQPQFEQLNRYYLPDYKIRLNFSVQDFIQVNADMNQKMLAQALALLNLQAGDTVVDLFCGLGNFSLPMAKQVGRNGSVLGIEGSQKMVARARYNAKENGLHNCKFAAMDLSSKKLAQQFANVTDFQEVNAILLDPPRAGAKDVIPVITNWQAERIVYISCNIATFTRDAVQLEKLGYELRQTGIMDMFPHTHHAEVIGCFYRKTA